MNMRIQALGFAAAVAGTLLLTGCAETQLASTWAKQVNWPGQQEAKGTYKVGNPYKVGNVWYYPEENFNLVETGIASWYGPGFHEDHTANGETFDQNELTAAHRTLQLPCLARVTNLENGHSVVVRINDRGPYLHGRIMDVSMRAAELLGFANKGTARVRLEVLPRESRMLAEAAKRGEDTSHMTMADLQKESGEQTTQVAQTQKAPAPVAAPSAPVKMASANTGSATDDGMPESLRTPTITVEELNAPGAHAAAVPHIEQASYQAPSPSYQSSSYQSAPSSSYRDSSSDLAAGHMKKGKFLPDPVVSKEEVHPTGLFVQAGSFSVYANAEKLTKSLAKIGPTTIDPVMVGGRKLYRVKVGPLSTVAQADHVLEKVIGVSSGAKVVKN
jgi:rare lipoprotein A